MPVRQRCAAGATVLAGCAETNAHAAEEQPATVGGLSGASHAQGRRAAGEVA